ncbi:MAG: hypothetical protein J6A00_06585 [Bacteroides sp.]|mgnify:FL=1|nr:hypothetical protein [Bacteroides sp.]
MKKYGTAEYILTLIQQYVDTRAESLTEEEKEQLISRCRNAVIGEYPSAKDLEVA